MIRFRFTHSLKTSAISAALVCCFFTIASAQITLHTNFESGSLDLVNSSTSGTDVTLRGVEVPYWKNRYRWVYFRASGVNGLQPDFQIGQRGGGSARNEFGGSLSGHPFFYTYDQQEWFKFDNNSGFNADYDFSNNSAFTQDDVYVAYSIPYLVTRTDQRVLEWSASEFVSPTTSANSSLAVGTIANTTPYGLSDLNLYGFTITDETVVTPKEKVLLVTGNHSAEMGGTWAFEGMIDFLLSADPRAAYLRKNAEFFVYPQIDPLGRTEGNYRANSQNLSGDHNRFWDSSISGDNGGYTEIDTLHNAIIADTGGDVDFSFDFHGFWNPGNNHIFGNGPAADHLFMTTLLALDPNMDLVEDNKTTPEGIFELWARQADGYNAEYSYTPEFRTDSFIEEYQSVGRTYGAAMFTGLGGLLGDMNGDGNVTTADASLFVEALVNRAAYDAHGFLAVDADINGDLNMDGIFDLGDLRPFNALLGGPAAASAQAVPEPTTLSLAVVLLLGMAIRPRRRV